MDTGFDKWLTHDKELDAMIQKIMADDTTITMVINPGDALAFLSLIWTVLIKHTYDDEQTGKLAHSAAILTAMIVKLFPDAESYLVDTMKGALNAQAARRRKVGRA